MRSSGKKYPDMTSLMIVALEELLEVYTENEVRLPELKPATRKGTSDIPTTHTVSCDIHKSDPSKTSPHQQNKSDQNLNSQYNNKAPTRFSSASKHAKSETGFHTDILTGNKTQEPSNDCTKYAGQVSRTKKGTDEILTYIGDTPSRIAFNKAAGNRVKKQKNLFPRNFRKYPSWWKRIF